MVLHVVHLHGLHVALLGGRVVDEVVDHVVNHVPEQEPPQDWVLVHFRHRGLDWHHEEEVEDLVAQKRREYQSHAVLRVGVVHTVNQEVAGE